MTALGSSEALLHTLDPRTLSPAAVATALPLEASSEAREAAGARSAAGEEAEARGDEEEEEDGEDSEMDRQV